MYKLYRYSIIYRVLNTETNSVAGKEFSVKSMYFLNYSDCQSEAVQIMRCPVPSFVEDRLVKNNKLKDVMKPFPSVYVVESLYVDDATYDELLNNHALKGVVF